MHYQKNINLNSVRLARNCGQFCNQEKAGFLLKAFALFGNKKHKLCQTANVGAALVT